MQDVDHLYEQVLVLRCQAGDAGAFAEVVRSLDPPLRLYVRKMLGRQHDAHVVDDVLQDVWVDVYRGLPRLAAAAAFRAWVYRIARGRVGLRFRRRGPPAVELGRAADEVAGPEATFSAEDAADVYAALDALDVAHREVLLLRFLEQMSYEQIAGVTGCGVGTVRSRLHYAKRRLRAELERRSHA